MSQKNKIENNQQLYRIERKRENVKYICTCYILHYFQYVYFFMNSKNILYIKN